MSETLIATLIVALIAAVPPSLLAYFAFLQSRKSTALVTESRADVVLVKDIVVKVNDDLKEVGLKVDGRFDKLVEDIRAVAFAEGKSEGIAAVVAEAAEKQRVALQSAKDRAEGLAEGRAEVRTPAPLEP